MLGRRYPSQGILTVLDSIFAAVLGHFLRAGAVWPGGFGLFVLFLHVGSGEGVVKRFHKLPLSSAAIQLVLLRPVIRPLFLGTASTSPNPPAFEAAQELCPGLPVARKP